MSEQELLALDGDETLAEFDRLGRVRMLMNGEKQFEGDFNTGRIVSQGRGTSKAEQEKLTDGLTADSYAWMRVPIQDLDSDDLYQLTVFVHVGDSPVIQVHAPRPVPRKIVERFIEHSAAGYARTVGDGGLARATRVGLEIKDLALKVLRDRIYAIEQSVRDALADDEVSAEDYAALRDYPVRLATVEKLAVKIQDPEPQWRSLTPKPTGLARLYEPPVIDMFSRWASEVEEDAKAAVSRMSGLLSSQQVVMSQRQRVQVERFQRVVTLVGAAVLVPGLVAAIFGANVDLPGRNTREGFWAMLLLMLASGLGSYALLRSIEGGTWAAVFKRRMRTKPPQEALIVVVAVLAVVALTAGLILLAGA